eukprot:Em0052g1a
MCRQKSDKGKGRHEIRSDASVHKPSPSTLSGILTMQWELQSEGDLYSVEPEVPASNWLFVSQDHQHGMLYIGMHKTSRHTGVQRIELSSTGSTAALLEQLVICSEWERPLLIGDYNHKHLFKEHTDAEIGCNSLGSLFVTHVMESEWGRNEEEMEELARSMHHSRREQRQTYDRRKSSAKISKAVDNSATKMATALGLSVGQGRGCSSSEGR